MNVKNDDFKYIAKVFVDEIEGWQECKIIHSYRNRSVVITRTGTQLDRIFKATENAVADSCVYFKREDEEMICKCCGKRMILDMYEPYDEYGSQIFYFNCEDDKCNGKNEIIDYSKVTKEI